MKEINPEARPKPQEVSIREQIVLELDQSCLEVHVFTPCRGRLGDRRIYDAETGRPINIRGEFSKPEAALAHFSRVAEALGRLP